MRHFWQKIRNVDVLLIYFEQIVSVYAIREGVKKKRFFGTLFQTMARWGSKVPNFLVKITIQLFLLIFRTLS